MKYSTTTLTVQMTVLTQTGPQSAINAIRFMAQSPMIQKVTFISGESDFQPNSDPSPTMSPIDLTKFTF